MMSKIKIKLKEIGNAMFVLLVLIKKLKNLAGFVKIAFFKKIISIKNIVL
jgi:hypothetical protein